MQVTSCKDCGLQTRVFILQRAGAGSLAVWRRLLRQNDAHYNKLGAIQLVIDASTIERWVKHNAAVLLDSTKVDVQPEQVGFRAQSKASNKSKPREHDQAGADLVAPALLAVKTAKDIFGLCSTSCHSDAFNAFIAVRLFCCWCDPTRRYRR